MILGFQIPDSMFYSLPFTNELCRGTCATFMTSGLDVELAFGLLLLTVIALTISLSDASVKIGLSVLECGERNRWLTSLLKDENCRLCSYCVLGTLEVNNSLQ